MIDLLRERKEVIVFCKCFSAAVSGINGQLITVEADIRNGLPCFQMVGGIAGEVKEAKDRVKIALENSGFILPPKHITVNMSPAEIRKEGTSFDLPVAAALLAAFGYLPDKNLEKCLILGELSLDGRVNKVGSLLPLIFVAKEKGLGIICPKENLKDLGWSDNVPMCGINDVEELAEILSDNEFDKYFSPVSDVVPNLKNDRDLFPFRGIYGNLKAKRALIIAAAGGHNVFLAGKAEKEKKKLAEAFLKLLPPLTHNEMIQILKMNSVMGEGIEDTVERKMVVLDPSQSVDSKNICGAHLGVLYCENVNSSKPAGLSVIKEGLKRTGLHLNGSEKNLPCSFSLITSGTLCPCGNYPDKEKCGCSLKQINKHLTSLDDFYKDASDLMAIVSEPDFRSLKESDPCFEENDKKILRARKKQYLRFNNMQKLNADMTDSESENYCMLSEKCRQFLNKLLPEDYGISDYFKLLRISRTIADLDDSDLICTEHIEEAFSLVGERRF